MWKPRIVIIGASGHGKVLLDALTAEGIFHVEGFIDAHKEPGQTVLGFPILGREEDLEAEAAETIHCRRVDLDRLAPCCAKLCAERRSRSQIQG